MYINKLLEWDFDLTVCLDLNPMPTAWQVTINSSCAASSTYLSEKEFLRGAKESTY